MTASFTQSRGNDQVFGRIEGIEKLTKQGLRRGMFRSGQTLRSSASQEILKGRKTGRIYVRRIKGGRRRRHQASAPGETHANLTGKLRRSLSFQLKGTREMEFGYGVSSGKSAPVYARPIEFGSTRIKARPSLKNALNREQGNLTQHFQNEIIKAQQ
jgi:hypothetical protein